MEGSCLHTSAHTPLFTHNLTSSEAFYAEQPVRGCCRILEATVNGPNDFVMTKYFVRTDIQQVTHCHSTHETLTQACKLTCAHCTKHLVPHHPLDREAMGCLNAHTEPAPPMAPMAPVPCTMHPPR